MGIMEYLKKKNKSKSKNKMTPIDILKEKAQMPKKEACDCVFCQNNDEIKNIKLVFVKLDGFTEERTGTEMINGLINQSPVYKIPDGMTLEEATRVLSYLNEIIESNFEMDYDTLECQQIIQENMPSYGFKVDKEKNEEMLKQRLERKKLEDEKASNRSPYFTMSDTKNYMSNLVNFDPHNLTTELLKVDDGEPMHLCVNNVSNTANLFIVNGNWPEFKRSDAYPMYASWFTPFVATGEIRDIYERINLTLPRAPMPDFPTMSM